MKFTFALLVFVLSSSAFAQLRPGGAGGATSGSNSAIDDGVIEEFKKLAKQCNSTEILGIDIRQIHEYFLAKALNDMVSGHDHDLCVSASTGGEHVTRSLDCYLTDKFKATMREFLKNPNSLDVIQDSKKVVGLKANGTNKMKKISKEEAQTVWDYFQKLVADKK